jgi:hypothetical protein
MVALVNINRADRVLRQQRPMAVGKAAQQSNIRLSNVLSAVLGLQVHEWRQGCSKVQGYKAGGQVSMGGAQQQLAW